MSMLTSALKLPHLFVSNFLEAVQWIDVETPESQRKMKAAKAHLVSHFKLEETHLNPVLFEAAEKNVQLKQAGSVPKLFLFNDGPCRSKLEFSIAYCDEIALATP